MPLNVQIGVMNHATDSSRGLQIGLYNKSSGDELGFDGLQVGLICLAEEGKYFQMGLLTIRRDAPWYAIISPILGFRNRQKYITSYGLKVLSRK